MSCFQSAVVFLLVFSCVVGNNEEGDSCTMKKTGEKGVCTHISNCTSVLEAAFHGVVPQVCSYVGTVSIVCCEAGSLPRDGCRPLPSSMVKVSKTGSKARDYCIDLAEKAYPCVNTEDGYTRRDICPNLPANDQVDMRIFTGDYPHLALLSYDDDEGKNVKGLVWHHLGTLIKEDWVITEAWCARSTKYVRLGGLRWNAETPTKDIFTVKTLVIHPDAKDDFNDVGLLQLDREATFSKYLFPACLHTGTQFNENELTYVTHQGSGYDKWKMTVRPYIQCSDLFPEGFRNATQLCARRTREELTVWEPLKRATLGVSGSPIQINNDKEVACTQLIIAITAGEDSTRLNLLTTRVYGVLAWIESVVWP